MFTGIVQDLCQVTDIQEDGELARFTIDLGTLAEHLELGASVAINGTCLTVTQTHASGLVGFDVIPQTLRTTTLAQISVGDRVNVERSLKQGDELGGHKVSGHVSATAEIALVTKSGHDVVMRLSIPPVHMRYLMDKGFVAIDGASLTISAIDYDGSWIEISLIPETLQRTTLGRKSAGDSVNLELDADTVAIVDTVQRVLADPQWRERISG